MTNCKLNLIYTLRTKGFKSTVTYILNKIAPYVRIGMGVFKGPQSHNHSKSTAQEIKPPEKTVDFKDSDIPYLISLRRHNSVDEKPRRLTMRERAMHNAIEP